MRTLLLVVALSMSCATTSQYAYRGMTRSECEAQCGSYGYPILNFDPESRTCECNTFQCSRPRHRGGCEKLPVRQVPLAPSNQM